MTIDQLLYGVIMTIISLVSIAILMSGLVYFLRRWWDWVRDIWND